jgi:hypothetical protein
MTKHKIFKVFAFLHERNEAKYRQFAGDVRVDKNVACFGKLATNWSPPTFMNGLCDWLMIRIKDNALYKSYF